MKVLDSNYTTKTLNSILGNQDLYRERFSDPNRVGLIFRVGKNNITANLRFNKNSKDQMMKIGSYPSTPLADIYSTWSDLRLKLDKGINPVKEKEAEQREAEEHKAPLLMKPSAASSKKSSRLVSDFG